MKSSSYAGAAIIATLCLVRPLCAEQHQSSLPGADLHNSYSASIVASMLPTEKSSEKIKILEGVVAQAKSLSPHLGLIESYFEANQLQKIVALLDHTTGLREFTIEYPRTGLVIVKTYVKLGMNNDAINLLVKLNNKHPTDQEIAFLTALFYEQKNEITNALKVADAYLNTSIKKQTNFAFLFLKTRLYTKIGNVDKALESIDEALKIQPTFDMGWLLFAQMKETKGDLEAAVKGYSNYLEHASTKPANAATQMLMQSIEDKVLKMVFALYIKKYPSPEHSQIEHCRNHIIQLFQQKKYKDVLVALDNCLAGKECSDEARLMRIQALGALKNYDQAAQLLTTWIMEDPNKTMWFEALHLLYFAGLDSHTIITSLLEIDKKVHHSLYASLYLADMFTRVADFQQALVYHKKALALTNEADLKTSIYFQMGMLYYEQGQHAHVKTALEAGKELGLDYAPLLNMLAYHYITKDNNLTEAEKIMEIVLRDSPDNPHYLDTQAILFIKQGKTPDALSLLEKIARQEPNDATILKHLAKTYRAVGRIDEAVACLESAVKLTYDTKKKQKYEHLVTEWKTKKHGKTTDSMLCRG
jgi:tetratricopeptide (TPR) repeat protein